MSSTKCFLSSYFYFSIPINRHFVLNLRVSITKQSFIMHFYLPTIALFFAAALLTFSYANVASLNRRYEDPCLKGRKVCSARQGHSKLIRLGRAMPLPSDPVFQNDLNRFMVTRTEAADNVVTDDICQKINLTKDQTKCH